MRPKGYPSGCSYVGICDGTNVRVIQVNKCQRDCKWRLSATISGGNLLLSPYNGNQLIINRHSTDRAERWRNAGSAGAGVGATLYIYAYNNAGSIVPEYSRLRPTQRMPTSVTGSEWRCHAHAGWHCLYRSRPDLEHVPVMV